MLFARANSSFSSVVHLIATTSDISDHMELAPENSSSPVIIEAPLNHAILFLVVLF